MSSVSGSIKDALDGQNSDQVSETKRKSRNMSEKKRRDQFNALINDLAAMVSPTESKLDKSSVLKGAVHFLQAHNATNARCESVDFGEAWKPPALSNEEFIHLMLEAVDGFLIAIASDGEILYTSENIVSILGHLPCDLVNNSIFGMLYSTEAPEMYRRLANSVQNVNDAFDFDDCLGKQDSMSPPSSCLHLDQTFPGFRNLNVGEEGRDLGDANVPKVSVEFTCHFKRHTLASNLPYTPPSYEKLKFRGFFKTCCVPAPTPAKEHEPRSDGAKGESTRRRHGKSSHAENADVMEKRRVLIAAGQVVNPQFIREMPPLVDTIKGEFISRHSLEWKFLYLDHRAPPIIGYLPFELLGTSGYDYYHLDDLDRISESHETLMETGDGQSCCYRFLTKGQEYIWLQSNYFISYHQWTSKPEFVVCTNRVVSYAEVRAELERERAAVEQTEQESLGSLTTYPSSPGFSSETSSYCTTRTGSNVGDPSGTPSSHARHLRSPSSSASSTVGSSVAGGGGSETNVSSPVVSKQQNLFNSVVGALLEETRLAAAAQAATTYRKSKSAIIPSRPYNETDVDGFREPFAYQEPTSTKHAKQRYPSVSSFACKRAPSPPPAVSRPQSSLLSPPPVIGRTHSAASQANLPAAETPSCQNPFRSASSLENRVEVGTGCSIARSPAVELFTPYDLPLTSGYTSGGQEGMYFLQPHDQIPCQLVQPHFIQVPLMQGIVPGMSYVATTTKDGRASRLFLKQDAQNFPRVHRSVSHPGLATVPATSQVPICISGDPPCISNLLDDAFGESPDENFTVEVARFHREPHHPYNQNNNHHLHLQQRMRHDDRCGDVDVPSSPPTSTSALGVGGLLNNSSSARLTAVVFSSSSGPASASSGTSTTAATVIPAVVVSSASLGDGELPQFP